MPALVMGTQVLGEPRYPSLRGIMAARSKEIVTRSLADLGVDPARVGAAAATTRVLGAAPPPPRAGATVLRTDPDAAVGGDHRLPRRSRARLMAGPTILALAELSAGAPTRLSLRARLAGRRSGRGRRRSRGRRLHRRRRGRGGARRSPRYVPRGASPSRSRRRARRPPPVSWPHTSSPCSTGRRAGHRAAARVARTARTWPASCAARRELPILVNAAGVERWSEAGVEVEMSAFGGRLVTRSGFTGRVAASSSSGPVRWRPRAAARRAPVERRGAPATVDDPVRVVERVATSGAAVSIDDAQVVVAGGRGVAGPDGFGVIEDLAEALRRRRRGHAGRRRCRLVAVRASRSARRARSSSLPSTSPPA